MLKGIPRIHKENTPPIAASGTAENTSAACLKELNVKYIWYNKQGVEKKINKFSDIENKYGQTLLLEPEIQNKYLDLIINQDKEYLYKIK